VPDKGGGGNSVGTGFAIGQNKDGDHIVLTNHHVVFDGKGHVTLNFYNDSTSYRGSVVKLISHRSKGDIVLIVSNRRRGPVCRILSRALRLGESVRWRGYPYGGVQISSQSGQVINFYQSGTFEVRSDRASISGESGSPVFDKDGNAVGIVFGGGGGFTSAAGATSFKSVNLNQCISGICVQPQQVVRRIQPYPQPETCSPGPAGQDGKDGKDGRNGTNGRGIASLEIVNSHLVVTYTDGEIADLGQVVGETGPQGPKGPKGDLAELTDLNVILHDKAGWEASGAGYFQTVDLASAIPTIHLPPTHLQVWDQHGSNEPILDLDSGNKESYSRLGEPIKIVNQLPE